MVIILRYLQTDEIQVASISPELFFQKGQFNNVDNVTQ